MKRALFCLVMLMVLVGCSSSGHHTSMPQKHTTVTSVEINVCKLEASKDGYHTTIYFSDGKSWDINNAWKPIEADSDEMVKVTIPPNQKLPYIIKYSDSGNPIDNNNKYNSKVLTSTIGGSGNTSDIFKDKIVKTKSIDKDIEVINIIPLELICIKYVNVGIQCWDEHEAPSEVFKYIQDW
ncbi:hypothetical protein KAR91_00680 [Candidatus Pacearchaeota archaeon]|nr:hypothetical protein [Candidatus Pacearchaeota archaeon]